MSSIRDPAYITDTGQTMMTAGGDITYTKAALYGQDISNLRTDQIKALTTIGNPLRETQMGVSGKKDTDGHTTVILEATFQNNNLKADLPYTAVGFFAKKDDKEKLVAVAVANKGAYLAATSPDGVATDALDLKLAITIGDTANVTTMIDPAGSVTPATLNGTIDKVTQSLTAKIDTKADKATVDAEIAKIDFTPYAKSADVAKDLQGYTTTADLTKLLAGKRDIADSYSRDELDKKFLQLSTDTSGKVSADQIAKLLASKVDKTDLTSQLQAITDSIGTKANSANVTAELAKKDNTADVDAKIKTVTDLANTKANASDVYNKQAIDTAFSQRDSNITNVQKAANAASQKADDNFNKRPVVSGASGDDLFAYKTSQLRYYPGNGQNCKNMPPASNTQWYTVEYIFETPNGDGVAIYRSPEPEIWISGNNGGIFGTWYKIASNTEITNLQNQVNTKASASDVNSLNQTISALQQTVQSLQNTVNQQATQITGLQTQVNNQANEIKQLQETTIKGKTFSKSQEAAAEAWEKQNSQQIAFILDN